MESCKSLQYKYLLSINSGRCVDVTVTYDDGGSGGLAAINLIGVDRFKYRLYFQANAIQKVNIIDILFDRLENGSKLHLYVAIFK